MNWGLGHASRVIFLIQKFLEHPRFEVMMAADGIAYDLLQSTFPGVPLVRLPSITIRYSRYFGSGFSMMLSLPKIFWNICREHQYLKKIIIDYNIDLVLSDNRYGLYHKDIHTIFLTHQLRIPFPGIFRWLEPLGQKINYWFINKYDFCWIPDTPETDSIGGRLSHPAKIPSQVKYIGPLSRFLIKWEGSKINSGYDIVAVLSGPEPQRTILEQMLMKQLLKRQESVLMLRGLPGDDHEIHKHHNIHLVSHMDAPLLKHHLLNSKYIICRSGYSSIMDLVALEKTAILIPTPGQPEQEYLASYLDSKKCFYYLPQSRLNLDLAFEKVKSLHPIKMEIREDWLDRAISQVINKNTS